MVVERIVMTFQRAQSIPSGKVCLEENVDDHNAIKHKDQQQLFVLTSFQ